LLDPHGSAPDGRLRRTLRIGGAQPHHLARCSGCHFVARGKLRDGVTRALAYLVLGRRHLGHDEIRRR